MYLTEHIISVPKTIIPCADPECLIIIEDVNVKRLVMDPDVVEQYNRLICNKFIEVSS